MLSRTAWTTLTAATVAFAAPAFAQDAALPEETTAAVEAATAAGVVETLASGDAYTVFIPTNTAIEAVATSEAATTVMADQAAFATLIQGYAIPGTVLAADAVTLVTDGGGTATVDSLAGTPIELGGTAEALTVNGATVTTPDLAIGNVTVHIIDTAFLPEAAM